MSNRILIPIGVLAAAMIPSQMRAQDPNEPGSFNFSMGGGFSVPVNPTARFAGVGGNFMTGGGYNIDKHNSIVGQFMWAGLPPTVLPPSISAITQLAGFHASVNLFSLTADYKYSGAFGSAIGYYFIGGGGWYNRQLSVSKSTIAITNQDASCANQNPLPPSCFTIVPSIPLIPKGTVCAPIWSWYGFTCTNGFVNTIGFGIGTSSFGGNGGVGLTFRIKDTAWKLFIESRYNYAASRAVATHVVPVTIGFEHQ
jgi:hypothetical protein